MKRTGLMVLLLSGCVLVCPLQMSDDILIRHFHLVGMRKNWTEAQRYCREEFDDIATIQDADQNTKAGQAAVAASGPIWIGFFETDWRWSLDYEEFSSFANWATGQPTGTCTSISEQGVWNTKPCGYRYYMMCYSAERNKHILVPVMYSWSDARAYCRSMYTDLSTIRNEEDNQEIVSELQSFISSLSRQQSSDTSSQDSNEDSNEDRAGLFNRNTLTLTVWIGLRRNFWMWSDRSEGSFSMWGPEHSSNIYADCTKINSTGYWFKDLCNEEHYFLCQSDHRPAMRREVKVRLSGGSADLKDPTVQDTILKQLKQKLQEAGIREEVKLRWRKQPDGNVFLREEERAPPAGGEEDDIICDNVEGKPGMK